MWVWAVITDAGDSLDIHPRNKTVTGERLAAWALAKQYGKDVTYSGPLFKTMKVEGNKAVLSFDYADDGLMTPDNEPVKGFIVAGEDRRFYPATALIRGDKLEVSAPQVSVPVAVRYAYCNFFRVNLYNKAGFPATPFRTDTWEPDSYARWFADSEMVRFSESLSVGSWEASVLWICAGGRLLCDVADVEEDRRAPLFRLCGAMGGFAD